MAYTRAAAETSLLRRIRGWFVQVQFDATTQNGTNADLNDPIAIALAQMHLGPIDPTAVVDSDLIQINSANLERFLAVAELTALRDVQGCLLSYSVSDGNTKLATSDLFKALAEKITDCEKNIARRWGDRVATCAVAEVSRPNRWEDTRRIYGPFGTSRAIDVNIPFIP